MSNIKLQFQKVTVYKVPIPKVSEARRSIGVDEVTYDIVIKGGLVIDPSQQIHEEREVVVSGGKIVDLSKGINATGAKHVIDARDMIVTPGIIDIHVHCCHKIAYIGIDPEFICLAKGSTTVLDAGSTGELNFMGFRNFLIDVSRTRIFALLNIESLGMIEFAKENQKWPDLITDRDEMFINIEGTLEMMERNRDVILGIKWAHHGLKGLELARKAADKIGCPLMAENHYEPETLKYLKKGDIVTHLFHAYKPAYEIRPHDGLLDEDGKVQPEFFDAAKRGVILDVGHGAGSFVWRVAEEAFKQGIRPNTISTDLHVQNFNGPVHDMPTTMSKFMLLGMSIDEVIEAGTIRPAEALGKEEEIGTLKPAACADITILRLEEGKFALLDVNGEGRIAPKKLTAMKVIRGGEIIV